MDPTYVEISRACERVLREIHHSAGRTPGVAVACEAIRSRVAMSDELWQRVSSDLRHGGLVCHDGDEGNMSLTVVGAAQAALCDEALSRTTAA
jgi:hypothetical protein